MRFFYQISDQYMPLYHNFGNQFFKLGEEAIIDLTTFTTSGKKRRGFRATLNKFDDLNINFELLNHHLLKISLMNLNL